MALTPRGLVTFDLGGTLLRRTTVCELLAGPVSRLNRIRPNPQLQRTPLRAPLSRKPFGRCEHRMGRICRD